ncbi:MAG: DUF4160 domain-containing protein [Candidatus Palauibacterales bacterium]|nr:DUF4160 domain-containing protein [Candidatus Palauibacterales bacterium]MDP2529271.1 DUF4160 domain-containing protein [Candidatus Palauibacterales bacterium]
MPTVLRLGPYRFFFYANDRSEPVHVHVRNEGAEAKFWLEPVRLAWSRGFAPHELRRLERLVKPNSRALMDGWHDYFEA